jgi:hypothetical protein
MLEVPFNAMRFLLFDMPDICEEVYSSFFRLRVQRSPIFEDQ